MSEVSRRRHALTIVSCLLTLAGCGDGPVDPGPGGDTTTLVIAPGAMLLAEPGRSERLRAYAIDSRGDSTEVAATFESSNPAIVAINGAVATAGSALGAASIVARSGELTSAPIIVLRAVPAAGAILVADSQVAGSIAPVDPSTPYAPGWQYRVRIRGLSVAPGQILLASGGAPVGGRVVGSAPAGSDIDVMLELLPLDAMFTELAADLSLPLQHATLAVPAALRAGFEVRRLPGGVVRASPRRGASRRPDRASRSLHGGGQPEIEFGRDPFICKAEVPPAFVFPLTLDVVNVELAPSLALDLVIQNAALERLVVGGSIRPRLSVNPVLTAALEAKAECKVEVATLILPIGGPLSLFVGGQVPLGVGFEIGAKAGFGQLGFDSYLETVVETEFGIDCAAGCRVVADIEHESPTGFFKPILPSLPTEARFEMAASAFGWGELAIGNAFLETFQFKAVEVKAGLEQKMELATREVQAADPAYASTYALTPVIEAKAAANLAPIAQLLRINLATLAFAPQLSALASSPRGSFTITPASVAAGNETTLGEKATFTVTLTDATYLGAYAIEGIQIRWQKADGTSASLEAGRPGCTDLEAGQDQLSFSCETDFLAEHAGAQTFYAFLETRIFDVPVPVPLEVAPDGKAIVTVTGGAVAVTPATATLSPGQSQDFTATVSGSASQAVTWSATGGTFTVSGNTLQYTAGPTPGTYAVTATSVAAPAFSASSAVTIVGSSAGSATLTNAGGFAQAFVQFPGSTPCNDIDESSQQAGFTASRTFTAECSGSWTSPPTDVPVTLTASASGNATYQLNLDGTSLLSVTAGGSATAAASAQGQPGLIVGGRGESHSADLWFDFEVDGTVTVTLSGQVSSSSSSTFESPRAFVSIASSAIGGTLFFAEQGAISTVLTLGPGNYTLRGDAYANAAASLPEPTSSNASASFSVTMTIGP